MRSRVKRWIEETDNLLKIVKRVRERGFENRQTDTLTKYILQGSVEQRDAQENLAMSHSGQVRTL